MAATPQELEAINNNTAAIQSIINNAEEINDKTDLAPYNGDVNVIVQTPSGDFFKTTLDTISENSNLFAVGNDGEIILNIGGNYDTLGGFEYNSGDQKITIPVNLETTNLILDSPTLIYDFEGGVRNFG